MLAAPIGLAAFRGAKLLGCDVLMLQGRMPYVDVAMAKAMRARDRMALTSAPVASVSFRFKWIASGEARSRLRPLEGACSARSSSAA
jgi:hypothetical protein